MTQKVDLSGLVNLAQRSLGAEVLSATDDFFAEKENLISPSEPVFIADKFTDRGKWMDGWESRRKRTPGHDSCVVRICRGAICAINIDTTHFTGNFPEQAMVEVCDSKSNPDESTQWTEILPISELKGSSHNWFTIESERNWTHVRLNIYPDGGVARLRVFGTVHIDWQQAKAGELVDLVAVTNGGLALDCSDMHFGSMWNLLSPGRAVNMGDGWETARRRGEGHDWVVLQLGRPGTVKRLEVDTLHFKGNYPAHCKVLATYAPGMAARDLTSSDYQWHTLLDMSPLTADSNHTYIDEVKDIRDISHVKIEIHPDGGVGRFRVFGEPAPGTPLVLQPLALSAENFAPFGEVIEVAGRQSRRINQGFAERYENLAALDVTDGGKPALSLFHAKPIAMPFTVKHMECHPRASQAFIPKEKGRFLILVAPPGDTCESSDMKLFVTNGEQGVNYKRGVWHHFLMALEKPQTFIVIDRTEPDANTKEVELKIPYPIITSFEQKTK